LFHFQAELLGFCMVACC